MRDWSFATLVTHGDQGLQATHLPFLLDPLRGPHGTLISHLARRNPQAADIQA
ncbi:FMN-binding domain protein, partial [Bordetella bronchiseptica E014]